jgi:hypothetical protein
MSTEDKIEDAADIAEDIVELAEDLGLISEGQEAKYKALIKKALPKVIIVLGGVLGIYMMLK